MIGQGVHKRAINKKYEILLLKLLIFTWKINQKHHHIQPEKNRPKRPKRQSRLSIMEGRGYLIALPRLARAFQHSSNILKMVLTGQFGGLFPLIIANTGVGPLNQKSSDDLGVSCDRSQMQRGVPLVLVPQIYVYLTPSSEIIYGLLASKNIMFIV